MKTMTYKGYTAHIHYSDEDGCFVGRIVDIDAIAGFHGDTDAELHAAFEDMVDLYIEVCEEPDRLPQRPEKGTLLSRVWHAFHQKLPRL